MGAATPPGLEPAVVSWLAAHRLAPLADRVAPLATSLDDVQAMEPGDLGSTFKPLERKRLLQAVAELQASSAVADELGGGGATGGGGAAGRRLMRIEETVQRLDRNVQQIVGMLTKQRYQRGNAGDLASEAAGAASRQRSWRAASLATTAPERRGGPAVETRRPQLVKLPGEELGQAWSGSILHPMASVHRGGADARAPGFQFAFGGGASKQSMDEAAAEVAATVCRGQIRCRSIYRVG